MNTFAKITAIALALTAGAAAAEQGDKITALGYGHTQQQAKIITIQTWTVAANDAYGYADWNTAYIGHMECIQNYAAATSQYSTLSREVIKVGGDQNAPWSCIVSGYQDVRTGYDTGYTGQQYITPDYKAPAYQPAPAPVHRAPIYKNSGHTSGYVSKY
ncbi:hypothetical protein [Maliponia aquimaris]|uniref:Uncharacterized protein n=1 Tax=Maliponia aquimaris TaxID=1673631 RepID=A0A238K2J1_9RHOB|nr:hypothetical protein [Maliponia aquimaris]SMX36176.1 hypothetical protein MAA8898_00777 [Maliponia aquimaris]